MTTATRTIAKNAGFLMGSQVITWGLTLLLTVFLPRYLGPAGIGQLQLATSLWAIVSVIAAMGTDRLVMKEISRSADQLNELVSTALALRALIFILGSLGMAAYLQLSSYPAQTQAIIWIVGVAALIAHLSGTYDAGLKGLERMEYTSAASVASVALVSLLQIGLVILGFGVIPIAAVGIIAGTASLLIMAYFLRKHYSFHLSVNWRLMYGVLLSSLPYFLVSIGLVLYQQVDTVIISWLVNEETIGWYSVAFRLYGTLFFIPNVFVVALFPALTRSYLTDLTAFRKLARKSLNLLILMSVPIGLGILVIADHLVVLLFGPAFAKSGLVLTVLGLILPMSYLNTLVGYLLIAMDKQKAWAPVLLIATAVTIPLDLFLIPWTAKAFANGALGGAFSFACTEFGMILISFSLLPKETFSRENAKVAVKVLLSGGVMTAVAWTVQDAFLLIPVVVSIVTYIGMIFLLRAIPKEDVDFFLDLGSSIFQRLRRRSAASVELKG